MNVVKKTDTRVQNIRESIQHVLWSVSDVMICALVLFEMN
jgi:hypothetical protein